MADLIRITGVKPYDGDYEFDLEDEPLTTLEWRWVKKIGGYLPLTMEDGWRGGDPDLFLAFAVIALHRSGKIEKSDAQRVADRLEGSPFGTAITLVMDETEAAEQEADDDVDPPVGSGIDSPPRSGGGSSSLTSVPSDADPKPIGLPSSGTSSTSAQETSAA